MSFGERMAEARKDKGLTQKGLAELMNVSQMRISHYENNDRDPDIEGIKAISTILDVSPNWLLGLQDIKSPLNHTGEELVNLFRKLIERIGTLDVTDLADVLRYTEYLISRREK